MRSNPQLRSPHRMFLLAAATGVAVLCGAPCARAQAPAASATAAALKPPEQLMRETIDAVFAILRKPELKADGKLRMQRLRAAVDIAFDWEAMAQSSLGPPWRKLDGKQRRAFVGVFKELLAQQYMDDIDRFQGSERVQVTSVEKSGELQTVKSMLITSSREKVPMDYTLQLSSNGWRVVDLTIEGVSMVNHYRDTFSRFLTNKTFAELMQQLERKLGAPATAAP